MRRVRGALADVAALAAVSRCCGALADEGGVSFWLPGQYGSLQDEITTMTLRN